MTPRTPSRTTLLATTLILASLVPSGSQEAAPGAIPDDHRQDQLDRIEAKLDALLQRLGDGSGAVVDPSATDTDGEDTAMPTPGTGADAADPAPETASEPPPPPIDTPTEAESFAPGAIAVAHAAPTQGQPLGEIPTDSIGGFVYTGGPIQLDDLADRGVRHAGPAGIELQGWLRATEAGRHQLAADLQIRFGTGTISALPCTFSGWLEGQAIGTETREADPWGARGNPCRSPSSSAPSSNPASTASASGSPAPTCPPPATARASKWRC
ncbi:hypothetical protein LX81_02899 [Palleronia aestuarii]|uniref:Uncharacterized protein n=1 Tax=Palleronia aestuarii TaxID=568105 RepID=A0A2W7NMD3_9RHOB|nr:hypothetical protein [Palleronia aestuarii]PZX14316.1 hypothetical protein LX81_02899 [Palleronia aestuarii]